MRNDIGNETEAASAADERPHAPAARQPTARARVVHMLLPVLAALLVFRPVTRAYFFGDDFVHLIEIVNSGVGRVLWRPFMGHLYVVPTLVYAVLWHVVGMRTDLFFAFVLMVHLLNVAAFFVVARTLTGSTRLASLAALGWGTSPLHAETLSWFCVHGQALGTTALLLGLYLLARAMAARRPAGLGMTALTGLALLAGSTCFGTTLAVATVFPLAAIACAGQVLGRAERTVLLMSAIAVLAGYVEVHRIYPITPGPRPLFGLWDTLADRWTMLTAMTDLLGVGLAGLVGSFVWVPEPFPAPVRVSFPSTVGMLLALGAALVIVAGAVLSTPGRRRWFLGLTILAVAAYGSVTVGRAVVLRVFHQSSSDLARKFRYHYAASVPLALMLTLAGATLVTRWRMRPALKDALHAGASVAWLVAFSLSGWHMDLHPDARRETQSVLTEATTRARDVPMGDTVAIVDRRFNPAGIWAPGFTSAGVFTLFHDSDELDARHIRYIPDPRWSPAEPPSDSRLARLLSPANGNGVRP